MLHLWQRVKDARRRRSRRLDANAIASARVAHEMAEREQHRETELAPGRSNTDWTYVPPS